MCNEDDLACEAEAFELTPNQLARFRALVVIYRSVLADPEGEPTAEFEAARAAGAGDDEIARALDVGRRMAARLDPAQRRAALD